MQLIKKGSTEGIWFQYKPEGGAPDESPAEFLIRRVPTGKDREAYYQHIGKRQEIRRKEGAIISDANLEATQAYQLELACYALVDSKGAEIPPGIVPGIEPDSHGLVLLDGKWSPEVRRAFFLELPALARWVVEKANSLTVQAAEEEKGLGKTS